MIEGLNGIIAQLERQKAAIERALAALREVDPPATAAQADPAATPEAPARKRRKFSAAARRKMALGQKARWAKINGEVEPQPPAIAEAPKAKRRISPEGMKRIIAASKKRWRLQKAAATSGPEEKAVAKKSIAKKAAAKKTAYVAPLSPRSNTRN